MYPRRGLGVKPQTAWRFPVFFFEIKNYFNANGSHFAHVQESFERTRLLTYENQLKT